jgi:nucleoside-diphosphate-sugar epimerase
LSLIEKNKGKMTVTILRPGLVYGSKNDTLPRDVAIRLGKKLGIVMGLGSRRLPLVYIDNLVDALVLAMESTKNGIYNIVDGEYPNQRRYIKCFNECQANKVIPIYVPFCIFLAGFWIIEKTVSLLLNKKVSLVYKLKCISKSPRHSTAKIENDLNWKQSVSFLEGLKR